MSDTEGLIINTLALLIALAGTVFLCMMLWIGPIIGAIIFAVTYAYIAMTSLRFVDRMFHSAKN